MLIILNQKWPINLEILLNSIFKLQDTFRKERECKWQARKLRDCCVGLQGPEHLRLVDSPQASVFRRQRHLRKLSSGFVLEQRRTSSVGLVRGRPLMTWHSLSVLLQALVFTLAIFSSKFSVSEFFIYGTFWHFKVLSLLISYLSFLWIFFTIRFKLKLYLITF